MVKIKQKLGKISQQLRSQIKKTATDHKLTEKKETK